MLVRWQAAQTPSTSSLPAPSGNAGALPWPAPGRRTGKRETRWRQSMHPSTIWAFPTFPRLGCESQSTKRFAPAKRGRCGVDQQIRTQGPECGTGLRPPDCGKQPASSVPCPTKPKSEPMSACRRRSNAWHGRNLAAQSAEQIGLAATPIIAVLAFGAHEGATVPSRPHRRCRSCLLQFRLVSWSTGCRGRDPWRAQKPCASYLWSRSSHTSMLGR